jgi:N6-L-threonylcarbamoyladenine synthase
MTLVLGIETSCDETCASVVRDGRDVLSNVVQSQIELHRPYGGVFPELASRQHIVAITPVIRQAMLQAQVSWGDLAAVAVVYGPGLAGSLVVGVNAAKAIAAARGLALVGVNHIEAHIYANWLRGAEGAAATPPAFPLVCLVVSGGHSELVLMSDHHVYRQLGRTVDDAAGEAFDKVARLLNLGYPGGPAIERAALGQKPTFELPRGLGAGPYDFSFSGLKTAVLRLVQDRRRELGERVSERGVALADAALSDDDMAQIPVGAIAASFQQAVVDALVDRTALAAERSGAAQVLMAGGVAANACLRDTMTRRVRVPLRFPPIRYCTDNAAMVGVAGYYRFLAGRRSPLNLDIVPGLVLE